MNSKQTEADYVPYGPEWEKEMSKFPKLQLIKMLGKAYQEKKELKQSLPSKPVGDVECESDHLSINEILNEFNRRGIYTENWDGDEGAEKAIVDGVCNYIEEEKEKLFDKITEQRIEINKLKSGYAAAPQKGGLPKLDEPLISQQDLEDYEKMEREEKSPSPSEAGDEISDADFEFMRECDFYPTSIGAKVLTEDSEGAYLDKADLIKLSGILLKYANTLAS